MKIKTNRELAGMTYAQRKAYERQLADHNAQFEQDRLRSRTKAERRSDAIPGTLGTFLIVYVLVGFIWLPLGLLAGLWAAKGHYDDQMRDS